MLDYRSNRLDYGRLLMPPEGHKLTQAVATTYSVDLDTLLSIPVALYYAQTLEGDLQGKDVQLIRAIQQTARLLTIYHQEGQLRVPKTAKDIYAYFEDSLIPILPEEAFKSFHPKTWMLRYANDENPKDVTYRLIVLSRNLTFDRSWDVAAHLDGKPGTKELNWNKPLVDFHTWLNEQRPLKDGPAFLDELARVDFEVPESFDDFEFHPIGIPGYADANPTAIYTSERLLCLSPFLHRTALDTLWGNVDSTPVLLGRRDELERLPAETVEEFDCYCLSNNVVEGEWIADGEEGDGDPRPQDLHAKLFLFDAKAETTWFLGSANATQAAFAKNVEFMLELKGTRPAVRLSKVRKQLLGNDETGDLFERFLPSETEAETESAKKHRNAIRRFEYALLEADMQGDLTQSENGSNFDLALTIDVSDVAGQAGFAASVRPFTRDAGDQPLVFGTLNRLVFPNISETSLSRFLHFTLREGDEVLREFLVRIEVTGIPQTRLDNIFKNIINSRDKFFSYLRFLLTGELSKEDLEDDPPGKKPGTGGGDGAGWEFEMPIYEQLLVTSSRNPGRMHEVDRVIASLHDTSGESVIPDDFLSLWEVFKAAVPHTEGSYESS